MNQKTLNEKAIEVINAVVCDYQDEDEDGCSLYKVSDYIESEKQPDNKCVALIYTYESYHKVTQSIILKAIELTETKEEIKELLEILFKHNIHTLYAEGTTHIIQEHIYWHDLK